MSTYICRSCKQELGGVWRPSSTSAPHERRLRYGDECDECWHVREELLMEMAGERELRGGYKEKMTSEEVRLGAAYRSNRPKARGRYGR